MINKSSPAGFTIIEVMIAVLLLSMSLVAIFGAQFSAVATAGYVKNITTATELGRCKMSEIELDFQLEGFQLDSVTDSGDCCEFMEGELPGEFTCEWEIKTITFPDMTDAMAGGLSGSGDTDSGGGLMSSVLGTSVNDPAMSGILDQQLGGMDEDSMESMGMGMISEFMPTITSLLEQAIRRVTVKVMWKEGIHEKDFTLVQYVTNPTEGPLKLLQDAATIDALTQGLQSQTGSSGSNSNSNSNSKKSRK
ncbi:MAG: prepilin-type N-terminal cleavage/methylation domain-containing protein [Deltaproteobacteria bacterium]|nr:prepilin-type N-terminal cleavage/methylation domain-containing protein [Deltaproteobacteria bacterium]